MRPDRGRGLALVEPRRRAGRQGELALSYSAGAVPRRFQMKSSAAMALVQDGAPGYAGCAADNVGFAPAATGRCGAKGTRHLVPLLALLLAGALWAPGLAADTRAPVKSLLEMRREHVVVQEWDLSCGAAALATLLRYQHGDMVTERQIAEGLINREEYLARPELVHLRQGFSLLDLKRYVAGRGYEGIGYGKLTLADLVDLAPVLVPVDFNGYNHFVVFRGLQGDRAVLADPAFGNRSVRIEKFQDAWLDSPVFGRVGFTVVRKDGREPPNRLGVEPGDAVAPSGAVVRQAVFR